MNRETFHKQRVEYFQIANRVFSDYPQVRVFEMASKLCDVEHCYSVIDNVLIYRDSAHLGYDGSKFIGKFMVPLIKESLNQAQ